jgi:hypothetical protein
MKTKGDNNKLSGYTRATIRLVYGFWLQEMLGKAIITQ